jgi:hypothetical protein
VAVTQKRYLSRLSKVHRRQMSRSVTFWTLIMLAVLVWTWSPKHGTAITIGRPAPDIAGENWINSKPLTLADLRGRVVLVEFWTYG